jgi:hypothetical protein
VVPYNVTGVVSAVAFDIGTAFAALEVLIFGSAAVARVAPPLGVNVRARGPGAMIAAELKGIETKAPGVVVTAAGVIADTGALALLAPSCSITMFVATADPVALLMTNSRFLLVACSSPTNFRWPAVRYVLSAAAVPLKTSSALLSEPVVCGAPLTSLALTDGLRLVADNCPKGSPAIEVSRSVKVRGRVFDEVPNQLTGKLRVPPVPGRTAPGKSRNEMPAVEAPPFENSSPPPPPDPPVPGVRWVIPPPPPPPSALISVRG